MAKLIFIRNRDNSEVAEAEAMAGGVLRDGYRTSAMLQPGEAARFSMAMCDSAPAHSLLRDAAGQPITLRDMLSGVPFKPDAAFVAAIEDHAAKASVPVDRYLRDHLRYEPAK
jgi:hypothetical protein